MLLLYHGLRIPNEGIGFPDPKPQSPFASREPSGSAEAGWWRLALGLIQTNRFDGTSRSLSPKCFTGDSRRYRRKGDATQPAFSALLLPAHFGANFVNAVQL
jgi:hypothetical protein